MIHKLFFTLIIFFNSCFFIFSENNPANISVSIFSGFKIGEISKSIYLNNNDNKLSKLIWDQKPVITFGLSSNITIKKLETGISFSFGTFNHAGEMHDYDWNTDGLNINHSISKCSVLQDINLELYVKYNILPSNKIKLFPVISVCYLFSNFHAHDGYGWYGGREYAKEPRSYDVAWDNPLARKALKIREIDYYRHTLISFLGTDFEYQFNSKISSLLGFYFSPFSYSNAMDEHYREYANSHYADIQFGFFSKFKFLTALNCELSKLINVFCKCSFLFSLEEYGKLYSDEYDDKLIFIDNQPSSSNIWNFDCNIGITFKF